MKRAETCPELAEGLSASSTRPVLSLPKHRGLCRDAVLSLSKDREVPGHAGEALPFGLAQGKLQRHVRAPGLCRGCPVVDGTLRGRLPCLRSVASLELSSR